PTEMTILPNLDILVAQRRGEILLYNNKNKNVKQAGYLDVYWKTLHTPGVNAEEGLLGIQADPDFSKNHFVYIYYSPSGKSVNRLSRFIFQNDSIDNKTEKIILEVASDREICCHTGGSIAFGKDRMLFVSTGDNSTPFDEPQQQFVNHGYAPLNDEPGHQQYDARRSAGNTNDLRGKILRIRMNEDGTYSIPEGNLFPKGTAGTRPEIYVMGDRNPYRISIDQKTGYLYWGEVGPDADKDSLATRGPRGYDELNQARKAGFFGWPLFIGNNYAYHSYDYVTGKNGNVFDPSHPVNDSRNNTGLQQLPPAQAAFIWYPYGPSSDFPDVGTGGRTAMAGPVYYNNDFPEETRYPDYYNGKLFFYEWMRGWIKPVTMQPNGDFDKMETFMEHTKFNNPVDMETGPDGRIYVLEYGSGWFAKNPDAGLARIDYNGGNRPPKIVQVHVSKTSGRLPFTVMATVQAQDPERKEMKYVWDFANGKKMETKESSVSYTYNTPGEYPIGVTVSDPENASVKSDVIRVVAGNEAPEVKVRIAGNNTFYFPGTPVRYTVSVEDRDDITTDIKNLLVTADYSEAKGKEAMTQGHQAFDRIAAGKNLVQSSDCMSCHKINEKSIGPAYEMVAQRYRNKPDSVMFLPQKIITGGKGVWGEVPMPPHQTLKETDARQIVDWILTLGGNESKMKSLPAEGSLSPSLNKPLNDYGVLFISATYTDKGGNNIRPLTGADVVSLRNSKMTFEDVKNLQGFTSYNTDGKQVMVVPANSGWFRIDSIDLSGITGASLQLEWVKTPASDHTFELHLDSENGPLLSEFLFKPGKQNVVTNSDKKSQSEIISGSMQKVDDGKFHNIYIVARAGNPKSGDQMGLTSLRFSLK
ncbi:MAG: PQQ-dependent sugar dehydrogenase, partial [Flavisolibacter sp.]